MKAEAGARGDEYAGFWAPRTGNGCATSPCMLYNSLKQLIFQNGTVRGGAVARRVAVLNVGSSYPFPRAGAIIRRDAGFHGGR